VANSDLQRKVVELEDKDVEAKCLKDTLVKVESECSSAKGEVIKKGSLTGN